MSEPQRRTDGTGTPHEAARTQVRHTVRLRRVQRPRTEEAPEPTPRTDGTPFARGQSRGPIAFLSRHRLLVGTIALAIVATAAAATLIVRGLAELPDEALIKRDARALLTAPSYEGGAYGSDEALSLRSVELRDRKKGATSPDRCLASVLLSYSNGSVSAQQEETLVYERTDGAWACTGTEGTGSVSFSTTKGIDQEKVLLQMTDILQRADQEIDDESTVALSTIYAGAQREITQEAFDAEAQTDAITVSLVHASTFTAYRCEIDAVFVFRPGNGQWELASATASDDAKDVVLTPVLGTWTGGFRSQESSGSKCFGAKGTPLELTIESVDAGKISGRLSCMVHYHDDITEDARTTDGDSLVTDVPFEGAADAGADSISFTCTTPEDASGSVELRLVFGTPEDPSLATATVTTRRTYEATFLLFPYEREAWFSDTFVLTQE